MSDIKRVRSVSIGGRALRFDGTSESAKAISDFIGGGNLSHQIEHRSQLEDVFIRFVPHEGSEYTIELNPGDVLVRLDQFSYYAFDNRTYWQLFEEIDS